MTDLERIELALYRVHDKRRKAFESGNALNLDTQRLLMEIVEELRDIKSHKASNA